MSESAAIDVEPLTPGSARRPRRPCSRRRRPEVVLVHLLPVSRARLVELDGRAAIAPMLEGLAKRDPRARPRRLSGRPRGRLGQPRAARGLRAPAPLEDPRPGRRMPGLVDRLLRRRRAGSRGQASRRALLDAAIEYARDHGATTLEAYPVESRRANASRLRTRTTARSRCSSAPVHGRRAAPVERHEPRPADRPARSSEAPSGSPPDAPTTSSVGFDIVVCPG